MDDNGFWDIIDATLPGEDVEEQTTLLQERLGPLTVEELLSFDEHYTRASHALFTWELWRAAEAMIGWCSEDVFADFRSWVISRGRARYEAIVAEPDLGLSEVDIETDEDIGSAESFGAAVGVVYREKVGRDMFDDFEDRPSADFPEFAPTGVDPGGDPESIDAAYPRITARFKHLRADFGRPGVLVRLLEWLIRLRTSRRAAD